MHINWEGIVTGILAVIAFIQRWLPVFADKVMPIILEVERRAKDSGGVLKPEDKKAIAMKAIAVAESSGRIKLNWIERLIVSKVIDIEARRLPDITVSKEMVGLIDDAVKEMGVVKPPAVPRA